MFTPTVLSRTLKMLKLFLSDASFSEIIVLELLASSSFSAFLDAAEKNGLYGLRGHAAVGGVRVNLYHGIDDDAYERLIGFLNAYGDKI